MSLASFVTAARILFRTVGHSLRDAAQIGAILATTLVAAPALAWVTSIDGTASGDRDTGRSIAVDPAGDVIVAGRLENLGTGDDLAVVKLSGGTGALLWGPVSFDGTEITAIADDSIISDMRVDAAGDVIVVGGLANTLTGLDMTVIKLSGATGAVLWGPVSIDGGANSGDGAAAVAVDASGDVVVAGQLSTAVGQIDFAAVKLSGATGAILWGPVTFDGTASLGDGAEDVEIDAAGDVIVAGSLTNLGASGDLSLVKLSGTTGAALWGPVSFSGGGAQTVGIDASGDVVAAGGFAGDLALVKVSGATGAALWGPVTFGGTNNFTIDFAFAMTLDSTGDAVAVGLLSNVGTGSDLAVIKVAGGTGATLWGPILFDGSDSIEFDGGRGVAVDSVDDVIAVGELTNSSSLVDFTVVKLSGVTGATVWGPVFLSGSAGFQDRANAVAVDSLDDVVVTGRLENTGSQLDLAAVKLDGSDGSDFLLPSCGGSVATIIGTAGDDLLVGTPGPDVIVGLGGNDTIQGGDGNDILCGGDGNDLVDGQTGDDVVLDLGDGNDVLRGGVGSDTLRNEGIGDSDVQGGVGDDLVFNFPEGGIHLTHGNDGADLVEVGDAVGGGSHDARGGDGDDRIDVEVAAPAVANGGTGDDVVNAICIGPHDCEAIGGSGDDGIVNAEVLGDANATALAGAGADEIITAIVDGNGDALADGGPGEDILLIAIVSDFSGGGGNGNATASGGPDDDNNIIDAVVEGDGIATALGGGGVDAVSATALGNGSAIANGGSGDDIIVLAECENDLAEVCNATAIGAAGNDSFVSAEVDGTGDALARGGVGIDGVGATAANGNARAEGGADPDFVTATGSISETAIGGTGDDIVACGNGGGQCEARGSSGNDQVFGTPGNDLLRGNSGSDECTGNGGSDTFVSCETIF